MCGVCALCINNIYNNTNSAKWRRLIGVSRTRANARFASDLAVRCLPRQINTCKPRSRASRETNISDDRRRSKTHGVNGQGPRELRAHDLPTRVNALPKFARQRPPRNWRITAVNSNNCAPGPRRIRLFARSDGHRRRRSRPSARSHRISILLAHWKEGLLGQWRIRLRKRIGPAVHRCSADSMDPSDPIGRCNLKLTPERRVSLIYAQLRDNALIISTRDMRNPRQIGRRRIARIHD